MGWSDSYLHAFRVHGREYGIARIGGISFSDDPRQVRLCDFRLRPRERFQYRYNFNSDWELELRIEAILPVDPTRRYPTCIGGQRVTPPEDCGGPQASMELLDRYRSLPIEETQLLSEVIEKILAGQGRDAVEDWEEFKSAGRRIKNYLKFAGKSFDRRSVNRQLALLTTEDGDSE